MARAWVRNARSGPARVDSPMRTEQRWVEGIVLPEYAWWRAPTAGPMNVSLARRPSSVRLDEDSLDQTNTATPESPSVARERAGSARFAQDCAAVASGGVPSAECSVRATRRPHSGSHLLGTNLRIRVLSASKRIQVARRPVSEFAGARSSGGPGRTGLAGGEVDRVPPLSRNSKLAREGKMTAERLTRLNPRADLIQPPCPPSFPLPPASTG